MSRIRARHAFDAVFELDRGQYPLFDQKLIALGVGNQQSLRENTLHQIVHEGPGVTLHPRSTPLLNNGQKDYLRPQHVMILKLGMTFKNTHANLEIVNLSAQFFKCPAHQARNKYLVVYNVGADQLKTFFVQIEAF